jgi:Ino eighty subunit 1
MSALKDILAPEPDERTSSPVNTTDHAKPQDPEPPSARSVPANRPQQEQVDDQPSGTPRAEPAQGEEGASPNGTMYTGTTLSVRRNASGSVSSVFSGNKIRHLKKEDGIPLWRKDIQYDFLRLVFTDKNRCFTKYSDKTAGFTFAEVYIDAMAKSSKCSKILKEKLLQDTEGAMSMAMVCLLVNVGRMNTTLNCTWIWTENVRENSALTTLQSFQKCALSCGRITPYPPFKPNKTPMRTSSCKMHLV